MDILEKLYEIQTKIKVPKNQWNEFGKYSYRNCDDIIKALKPFLKRLKLLLFLNDEVIQIGDRYYIKSVAKLYDVESGDAHKAEAYAREDTTKKGMDGSQITGAASSYACKYALSRLLGLDDGVDPDTTNQGQEVDKSNDKQTTSGKDGAIINAANFWQQAKLLGFTKDEVIELLPRASEPLNDTVALALFRQLRGLKNAK